MYAYLKHFRDQEQKEDGTIVRVFKIGVILTISTRLVELGRGLRRAVNAGVIEPAVPKSFTLWRFHQVQIKALLTLWVVSNSKTSLSMGTCDT